MMKYYVIMFLVAGVALYYVFLQDPCHKKVSEDFASKYPGYVVLSSTASDGSPQSVRCNISYRNPDSEQTYEDVWLYENSNEGWKFSEIIESGQAEQKSEDQEQPPSDGGAPEA